MKGATMAGTGARCVAIRRIASVSGLAGEVRARAADYDRMMESLYGELQVTSEALARTSP